MKETKLLREIKAIIDNNNLDPDADYTIGEIRIAVNKRFVHNQHRYGDELRQIGVL